MHPDQRARTLAAAIEQAGREPAGCPFRVTVHLAGAPINGRTCPDCGHPFTGEVFIVERNGSGRRAISERSLHHLAHGSPCHNTGEIVDGQPVRVEIDLAGWEAFLDLHERAP